MRIIFCLFFLLIHVILFCQTTNAVHPDCKKEGVTNLGECTTVKIQDFIIDYIESQIGFSKDAPSIQGFIGLDISDRGLIELSELEINGTNSQKEIIKEAVKRMSYRMLLTPAEEDGLPTYQYKRISINLGDKAANSELSDSANISSPSNEEVFKVVEDMPRFPGLDCEDIAGDSKAKKACADKAMLQFIYKQITYPAIARKNGVEGTVVIQFVIEKDGFISNVKIVRDIGSECGQEALRVVKAMNDLPKRWISGKQRGKPVRVQFNLPIKFRLG